MRQEAAIQFEQIWNDYNDPAMIERRKMKERREKRREKIKEDIGL